LEALRSSSPTESAWLKAARHDQLIPPGDWWLVWLIMAGRGWGKSRTGSETVNTWARSMPGMRIALAGATAADIRDVMLEGNSGLCSLYADVLYEPSKRRVTWPNGATGILLSADEPNRFRGPQYHKAWCDELAAWRYPESFDQLRMGLRLPGCVPQVVVTTTPRPTAQIKALVKDAKGDDPRVLLTTGSTFDNAANLSPEAMRVLREKYEGTRLGRQELYAALLEDVPGALWKLDAILRIAEEDIRPTRVIVSIDPSGTNNTTSDEAGIVVTAVDKHRRGYVLEDASGRYSPNEWACKAIELYEKHSANLIVAEANFGADMVEHTLRTARPEGRHVPFRKVNASRGKRARAEPVAALYEQGKVFHVGVFPKLEEEMTTWDASDPSARSPNRVDALVWGLTELDLAAASVDLTSYADVAASRASTSRYGGMGRGFG
jgi:predicted phage terminase large subunit-like protein